MRSGWLSIWVSRSASWFLTTRSSPVAGLSGGSSGRLVAPSGYVSYTRHSCCIGAKSEGRVGPRYRNEPVPHDAGVVFADRPNQHLRNPTERRPIDQLPPPLDIHPSGGPNRQPAQLLQPRHDRLCPHRRRLQQPPRRHPQQPQDPTTRSARALPRPSRVLFLLRPPDRQQPGSNPSTRVVDGLKVGEGIELGKDVVEHEQNVLLGGEVVEGAGGEIVEGGVGGGKDGHALVEVVELVIDLVRHMGGCQEVEEGGVLATFH
ncbi:hypothetical protein U1Q18_028168 [Sarracenia purpurea var. burkii]